MRREEVAEPPLPHRVVDGVQLVAGEERRPVRVLAVLLAGPPVGHVRADPVEPLRVLRRPRGVLGGRAEHELHHDPDPQPVRRLDETLAARKPDLKYAAQA